ncbi:unnamed protein product [Pleuronectes platessa]|uniref:Uncharacterized protein n=1 Tax=Pleuronectes platessa TaxID=8262 RepID=A0A9N7YES7_PLEPL|nr:unnamed protein product [Pleuronectes platessa]
MRIVDETLSTVKTLLLLQQEDSLPKVWLFKDMSSLHCPPIEEVIEMMLREERSGAPAHTRPQSGRVTILLAAEVCGSLPQSPCLSRFNLAARSLVHRSHGGRMRHSPHFHSACHPAGRTYEATAVSGQLYVNPPFHGKELPGIRCKKPSMNNECGVVPQSSFLLLIGFEEEKKEEQRNSMSAVESLLTTAHLQNLHWLPVPQPIQFKIVLLTHKAPQNQTVPHTTLRSSEVNLWDFPCFYT